MMMMMTIVEDEHLTVKDDEINDLSLNNINNKINRRKQIKPNRVTTDDDVQQPQPEVYCNLCDRSFCNKYFLKTHLAKKHADINLPSSPLLSSSENNDQPKTTVEKSSEDYCEICQKHFCNKYYLRKHKGECHGVYTDYIKSLQKSSNENPVKNNLSNRPIPTNPLLLNPFYPGPSDIKSLYPIPSSISPPQQRTLRRCHLCQIDFRNRALFRMHMNTFHPNEKTKKNSSANIAYVPPFVDTSSQLAQKLVTGQTSQAIVNDSYFSAKMADRVVCEICNKQVCNKYFLKTHKAKVHGITASNDNTEQQKQTYCSQCQKDFPSKYFYLFHMQTVHNDTSDPAYQTLLQLIQNSATRNENSSPCSEPDDDNLKRKRTSSQSSNDNQEDTNAGLQPFLIESEDPTFSHTFVPCMVYLPVTRRVTQQVKINLRLKPVLAENSS